MFRILIIGAHPDDCEVYAGGAAALWRKRGDRVRFVSVTNGNAGHQSVPADVLAARRRGEAEAAARVIGAEHEVLDNDDGALEPTLRVRGELIRLVRRFAPDLLLTHRPNDYHPDHRYTSVLVQDSAFLVTVPKICPDTPHLARNPVIAYLQDDFRKPCPFSPDVAIDVDAVMDRKWAMIDAHASPSSNGTLRRSIKSSAFAALTTSSCFSVELVAAAGQQYRGLNTVGTC